MDSLSKLKHWLLDKRRFSTAWFVKEPQAKPKEEEALTQLPDAVSGELLKAINNLPTPPHEQTVVLEAVSEAVARWREHPQRADASIVILAHPVSSLARILADCLTDEESGLLKEDLREQSMSMKLLDWVERPTNVEEIKDKIKHKLGWEEEDFPSEGETGCETRAEKDAESIPTKSIQAEKEKNGQDAPLTLAVIPNLGWCFLRSADGLEGIDYLQEMLLDDRRQFWVIGSGQVGWEYLHFTLKLGAYCGEPVTMPKLDSKQLQSWLEPVIDQFDIRFSNQALHQRLQESKTLLDADFSLETLDEIQSELRQEVSATARSSFRAIKQEMQGTDEASKEEETPKQDYFDRLADISDGVSVVALQLFVHSLRYRKADPAEFERTTVKVDKANQEERQKGLARLEAPETSRTKEARTKEAAEPQLIAIAPKLPPLPDLDQGDLYLLYSLMLHGDLTIRALAESLGDPPQIVNNQVQVLRSTEVVEQKDGVVKINPVHYPNLRRELSRNNFIIEVP